MTTINLFEDQQKFLSNIRRDLVAHRRICAVAPTGSGKTKTFITITRMAVSKGSTVLIITESIKIFTQIRTEQHGRLIAAGSDNLLIRKGQVYIAMAQTLKKRPTMLQNFAYLGSNLLVINDEAHIGTATKILEAMPEAYLIGFTATPDARTCKHIPTLYNKTTIGPQPSELIRLGRLMPYRHFARVGVDVDQLKIQNGEFTEASQEQVFETRVVYDGLMEDLRQIKYYKAGIYCASIKHCDALHEELTRNGFVCIKYYSGIPDSELERFTKGTVDICISCMTLTKGWDFPPIDLIIFQIKTNSLPKFCQIIGRGSRLSPATGKTHFTVLDYGENFKQHGLWDQDRDWEELAKPPKKKKKGAPAPIKICPSCDAIVPASARMCDFCGYQWPKLPPGPPPDSKLIEVTSLYQNMIGRRVSTLSPDELAIFAKLKNKKSFAVRVAKAHEQQHHEWMRAFGKAMGYKDSWYWMNVRDLPMLGQEKVEFTDFILS